MVFRTFSGITVIKTNGKIIDYAVLAVTRQDFWSAAPALGRKTIFGTHVWRSLLRASHMYAENPIATEDQREISLDFFLNPDVVTEGGAALPDDAFRLSLQSLKRYVGMFDELRAARGQEPALTYFFPQSVRFGVNSMDFCRDFVALKLAEIAASHA